MSGCTVHGSWKHRTKRRVRLLHPKWSIGPEGLIAGAKPRGSVGHVRWGLVRWRHDAKWGIKSRGKIRFLHDFGSVPAWFSFCTAWRPRPRPVTLGLPWLWTREAILFGSPGMAPTVQRDHWSSTLEVARGGHGQPLRLVKGDQCYQTTGVTVKAAGCLCLSRGKLVLGSLGWRPRESCLGRCWDICILTICSTWLHAAQSMGVRHVRRVRSPRSRQRSSRSRMSQLTWIIEDQWFTCLDLLRRFHWPKAPSWKSWWWKLQLLQSPAPVERQQLPVAWVQPTCDVVPNRIAFLPFLGWEALQLIPCSSGCCSKAQSCSSAALFEREIHRCHLRHAAVVAAPH